MLTWKADSTAETRALDLDVHAIAGAAGDGEAVGLGEEDDGVVVGLGGAEAGGELAWG